MREIDRESASVDSLNVSGASFHIRPAATIGS
jgi:hypothetical protein